jgi:serine/threonine protein kinase
MTNRAKPVPRYIDRVARADSGHRHGALPEDLLQETTQRLALFCAVGAGTWTIAVIMANVLRPASVPTPFPWPGNLIGAVMIAALAAGFFYVRRQASRDGERILDLGLGLLVVNALAIAVINEWLPTFPDRRYVSWNTILILVYAMVVPTAPRKMLAACLLAASMDPLAVGMANLRGLMAPSFGRGVLLYYPNYLCAVIAVLPSIALHRMGRTISTARELGSYELVEKLGEGGMGEVWRGEHRLLVRPAAIKLVRPEVLGLASDQNLRVLRRFEREAQATAVLNSPHTIDLFDFGLTRDGMFYYVMELLIGRDLESLVRGFGALPADRVTYLLRQICHSLAEAHVRGLVHRDIKPANVYVCRMGLDYDFVKVLDFGLVKFSGPDAIRSALLSTEQMTSGTPAYMAPEVILGETHIDPRADVYSIGCLAYWMLTGHLVFEAESSMKMLMAHLDRAPVPPSERTELPIPRELDQIVLACLAKDPGDRPQNAEVLWEMSLECKGRGTWSRAVARRWWETHLPELTQPLLLAVPAGGPVTTKAPSDPRRA